VSEACKSFSGLLGQLLQLSAAAGEQQPDCRSLSPLHRRQQQAVARWVEQQQEKQQQQAAARRQVRQGQAAGSRGVGWRTW
jgi:hypothetical protein